MLRLDPRVLFLLRHRIDGPRLIVECVFGGYVDA
jgi:hypothetical protein